MRVSLDFKLSEWNLNLKLPSTIPILAAGSVEAVQSHIAETGAQGGALEVQGGGTKRPYGRRVQATQVLEVSGLQGVVDYQPNELILVVRPGTPLSQVITMLEGSGQMLAFEPPFWGEGATLGGVIACNLSGPRRMRAGAARDHLLGFQVVTGGGDVVRGGGRVVKNVTGYDLSKLMCGSFGTLAVFTELCVKVLPRPETERTVIATGLDARSATDLMIHAARSSHEVSGLVYLPAGVRLPEPVVGLAGMGQGLAALRVEGPEPSVASRAERLVDGSKVQTLFLEQKDSRKFWEDIRERRPLPVHSGNRLWRLSTPPSAAATVAHSLNGLESSLWYMDWGGALTWALLPRATPATVVHGLVRKAGGHAHLVLDPQGDGQEPQAFSPLDPGLQRLHMNLKNAFDPKRVLNPGRMFPEL